jgi:hypothetical protein
MPVNSESTKFTFHASSLDSTILATAKVGNGSSRAIAMAQGNCRFTAIAVDYFTKWVEAKTLVNINATTIQKFFWQNIIYRFGVPRELTVDNGKQFDCYTFKDIARPWVLMRNFRRCIIRSPMEQLKGQMA